MCRDMDYVRQHGGRDLRCPLCNEPFTDVAGLPPLGQDGVAFFELVRPSNDNGLSARDAKDLLKAVLWLDAVAVDELVDSRWQGAVGHTGINCPSELLRLVRMAGSCAGRAAEADPPLLVDDPEGWFDFWAADVGSLTRDTMVRALIKTLGTSDEDRDELRATTSTLWDIFFGSLLEITRGQFTSVGGMAEALIDALCGPTSTSHDEDVTVPPGFWACTACTLHNPDNAHVCAICEASRPSVDHSSLSESHSRGNCPTCGFGEAEREICRQNSSCISCRRNLGMAMRKCDCGVTLCPRCSARLTRRVATSRPSRSAVQATSIENSDDSPPLCPNCCRRKPPEGILSVRGRRWCQCSEVPVDAQRRGPNDNSEIEAGGGVGTDANLADGESSPLQASQELPSAVELLPVEEPVETSPCVNCGRPAAPSGCSSRVRGRWCQCKASTSEDLRDFLRTRQRQRANRTRQQAVDLAARPAGGVAWSTDGRDAS